ncbi:TetR/AcrR family transcriptional regulator [Amycolatopsis sp. H20-H5]|uniref:TetR/AcrR family transcriptional regulator n=1 Tax=Amycolatopsis sp. H20-H5 TaxID=3046309 RepID=UPI002DB7CB64|nr:TetR/AcrR family transcriptional regulator [Amycolatopsis sp. H20-H5]MEC3980798.1 TetR/AcrR family transcriptional regulator [Amycolatopsis sp. H20-H5]
MARLSRAESQARTREQLVTTAKELFLRDGYSVTSLEKVADEAGYSKGAVYSNFRNKDELCLAVLDSIHDEQVELVAEALTGADGMEGLLNAFQAWAERSIGDEAWTALEVEFATNARRDPQIRHELAVRDKAIRDTIAGLLTGYAERFGITLPMSADDAATALLSLGIGLGVQRAIDPTIPVTVLPDVIRLFAGGRRQPGACPVDGKRHQVGEPRMLSDVDSGREAGRGQ